MVAFWLDFETRTRIELSEMIQNCFVVFHAMKLQFSFGNMGVGLAIMADPLERCSTPAIKYERTKERVKKKKIHKTAERSRRFSETASPFAKTGFPRKKKPKKKMTKKTPMPTRRRTLLRHSAQHGVINKRKQKKSVRIGEKKSFDRIQRRTPRTMVKSTKPSDCTTWKCPRDFANKFWMT